MGPDQTHNQVVEFLMCHHYQALHDLQTRM